MAGGVVSFLGKLESCENSGAPSPGECGEQYRPRGDFQPSENVRRPTKDKMQSVVK